MKASYDLSWWKRDNATTDNSRLGQGDLIETVTEKILSYGKRVTNYKQCDAN